MPRSCLVAAIALAAASLAGCRAVDYRKDADRTAYAIVAAAQKRALGHEEPFSIESPADTLRRRLLIGQDLPKSGPASLGADKLPPVPGWPKGAAPPVPKGSKPIEPPWKGKEPCRLSLAQALAVAARNNRSYQSAKEDVFRSALQLDMTANQFRTLLSGGGSGVYTADLSGPSGVQGGTGTADVGAKRLLKNGVLITTDFAVDLVKLLTQGRDSSLGLLGDVTITLPLFRGAGEAIAAEPLTQAKRNVAYSLWSFEREKETLAVQVASEYLNVLQQGDQVRNALANYRSLITSTRRARRLAQGGELPQIQVDQSVQDELSARDRWVNAQESEKSRLDALKVTLGLPVDANVELNEEELTVLDKMAKTFKGNSERPAPGSTNPNAPFPHADAPVKIEPIKEKGGGPLEIDERKAVELALHHRTDLRTALGQVFDAQRKVVVAADALKLGLNLTATGNAGQSRDLGSAILPNGEFHVGEGVYSLGAILDLPLERTAERDTFRESYIALEQALRNVQELEDKIKENVRDDLRGLVQARESYFIQVRAVEVAASRVKSTTMFLEAGQAQIRDVLEAQAALISAQNAKSASLVQYRVAELQLQADMGVLEVDSKGEWREYQPEKPKKH